ncbi:hypothetical protein BDE02_04G112800 [Populus trichocarpa]|nr:hypothetical protein BDE02_04G112800 [Populus trichocarpa]
MPTRLIFTFGSPSIPRSIFFTLRLAIPTRPIFRFGSPSIFLIGRLHIAIRLILQSGPIHCRLETVCRLRFTISGSRSGLGTSIAAVFSFKSFISVSRWLRVRGVIGAIVVTGG